MIVFPAEYVVKYVLRKLLLYIEEQFPLIWINVFYVKIVVFIVRLMQFQELRCIKKKSLTDSVSLNSSYVCTAVYVMIFVHMMQLIKMTANLK